MVVRRTWVLKEAPAETMSGSFFFDLARLTEFGRYTVGQKRDGKCRIHGFNEQSTILSTISHGTIWVK